MKFAPRRQVILNNRIDNFRPTFYGETDGVVLRATQTMNTK